MNQVYTHFWNLKENVLICYELFQLEAVLSIPYPILLDIDEDTEVQNFD